MKENFVKIDRSMLAWEWFSDPTVLSVFLYLLLSAQGTDGKHRGYDVPKGSTITNHTSIAKHCGLTVKQVRRAIVKLEQGRMITTNRAGKGQLVTLVNSEEYLLSVNDEGRKRAGWRAGKGQDEGREKEVKKEPLAPLLEAPSYQSEERGGEQSLTAELWPSFADWWAAYRKGSKKLSAAEWDKLSQKDREAAFTGVEAYIASRPDPKYRKDGERFLKHRTWEDPIVETNNTSHEQRQANRAQELADALRNHLASNP